MKSFNTWLRRCTLLCLLPGIGHSAGLSERYVDRYLQTFPTRATAAGLYRYDDRIESLGAEERQQWIDFNIAFVDFFDTDDMAGEDVEDLELLRRQIGQEIMEWRDEARPLNDPLFWAEPLSQTTLHLLLRQDRPAQERLGFAATRTEAIPGLVAQALAALAQADPARVIPERAREAAARLRALAGFYRNGLATAEGADASLRARLRKAGARAANAIARLADRADAMADAGTADFRLGKAYETRFRLVTGLATPVPEVLQQAHEDLVHKRAEAAAYGRGVWSQLRGDEPVPLDDDAVLRALFQTIEAVHPASTADLVAQYRSDADAAFAFAARHQLMTLPEPRTLVVGTAPAWLGGQSVGGVYPAGPFKPDAETLFLLPNVPDDAPAAAKQRFYGAFNTAFNRMIVPHELVPGHYVQLKVAARQPHALRSLFGDGVYTEGWGSFSERLMLDLGWGGPPERLAHYKKQLENIARLIADISVHTEGWNEERLRAFLREQAVLDEQFAANMWKRAQLTSPQLTTYHLGYRDIHALWLDWRRANPQAPVREFVDGMLSLGAVPVAAYRAALLH